MSGKLPEALEKRHHSISRRFETAFDLLADRARVLAALLSQLDAAADRVIVQPKHRQAIPCPTPFDCLR
jgi:hypothetical protein